MSSLMVLWTVNGFAWLVLGWALQRADGAGIAAMAAVTLVATYGFLRLIVPRGRRCPDSRRVRVAPASPDLVRALLAEGWASGAGATRRV